MSKLHWLPYIVTTIVAVGIMLLWVPSLVREAIPVAAPTINVTGAVLALAEANAKVAALEKEVKSYREGQVLVCAKAVLWTPTDYGGLYSIGESEICGYNMGWSATYGPSMEAYISSLQREVTACQASLKEANNALVNS